jgi:hypothetical protein
MAYSSWYTLCMAQKMYNSIQQYNSNVNKITLSVRCLLTERFPRCFGLKTAISEKHRNYRQCSITKGFNINMIQSYKYHNIFQSICLIKQSMSDEIIYYN